MTSPTAPTATSTGKKSRPVDAFLTALARSNPFSHHRVTATGAQPIDVPSIHDAEFRTLISLAERVCDQDEAVGVVVWGESGSGKSNLLRRLAEWAADGRAVSVNFLELQAAPDRLHRAVLTAVVSALTNGFAPPWHRTPLYLLLEGLIRPALPVGKQKLSPADLGRVFRDQMTGPVAAAGATPVVRSTVELLLRFLTAALAEKSRRADGSPADAIMRRLSGDALDEEEAKAVGARGADAVNPLDAADSTRVLALLAQVARLNRRPLILCFDQINSLPRQQIADVSRLLHELNDRLRNTLLVLSEVRIELVNLTETGVISQATWDRLAANKVEMPRLTVPEGRRILEARLEQFLTHFEGEEEVKRHYTEDPLFPLGEAWFANRFSASVDVRPRRMIDAARERWDELQKSLDAAPDKGKWLEHWPNFSRVDLPVKTSEQLIDEQVEKAIGGRVARHAAAPNGLPPNADNLCGLVESLLAAGGFGLAVGRPKRGSPYDLLVRSPKSGGGETTAGLVFLATGSSNSITSALGRLAGDAKRPDRVILVTDQRLPLAFGRAAKAQGRNHYAALEATAGFEHAELPFAEYAALEVLDTVGRQESDLEISPPGGTSRPLKRDEVIASYRRTGRFTKHPLLGRFVGVTPPTATTLTDVEVRTFVGGQVALTVGTDTHELARQFLNGLPADRRAGLDTAACRSRIEAVAKTMAEAGDITMTRLGDGYFLLPKRRPAAG
ncbi:MAG: ATP-binding protein [Planctomycetes bacterium]|nr:ATP-binding protein [Planctomycetota bacterium]